MRVINRMLGVDRDIKVERATAGDFVPIADLTTVRDNDGLADTEPQTKAAVAAVVSAITLTERGK